jgi:FKBP-type peptidyl-prolyl cis-trans isomerase SlyD
MKNENLVVADDMVVRLDYTLTLADGEVFDSSEDAGPLEYLQGHGQIIPGLEAALAGMKVGDSRQVVVTPEYGYGEYDADSMQELPRDLFPAEMELEEGMMVDLYDEEADEEIEAVVAEVNDDVIVVDFNHPLAGETLTFDVKILGIRPATAEEIAHGHAHGEGHAH